MASRQSAPTQLCKYSIHVYQDEYEVAESLPSDPGSGEDMDLNTDWPADWQMPPYEKRLLDNLESNDFSSIPADKLPIAISQVTKAASRSNAEVLKEGIGFVIMGRNPDLLNDLLEKAHTAKVDVKETYPHHLAAAYIDGSKTCCQILEILLNYIPPNQDYNELGYTILDTLFLSVLRSHSTVKPSDVDDKLGKANRFQGEETDICGRWDADSREWREEMLAGQGMLPNSWKHKFCHTSAQAVTHCIARLDDYGKGTGIDSGPFHRLCTHCGLQLVLGPLHTFVVVSWLLANSSLPGEDLFGALCCLMSLLQSGTNPTARCAISVNALLKLDLRNECDHELLSPAELAGKLSLHSGTCTQEIDVGWRTLRSILQLAEAQYHYFASIDDGEEDAEWNQTYDFPSLCSNFCVQVHSRNPKWTRTLGHIWAAAQSELLNYRRAKANDPWLSAYFDMKAVLQSLELVSKPLMPLITDSMMNPYCRCGRFEDAYRFLDREVVAAYYFSNMDDWEKTTFIDDNGFGF